MSIANKNKWPLIGDWIGWDIVAELGHHEILCDLLAFHRKFNRLWMLSSARTTTYIFSLLFWNFVGASADTRRSVMATYRIYLLDQNGHISRPARLLEASDDQQACELATPFTDGLDVEVWHEARVVAKYTPLAHSVPASNRLI